MIRGALCALAMGDVEQYQIHCRSSTSAVVTFGERRLSFTTVKPFRDSVIRGRSSPCGCNSVVCSSAAIAGATSSSFGVVGGIDASSQERSYLAMMSTHQGRDLARRSAGVLAGWTGGVSPPNRQSLRICCVTRRRCKPPIRRRGRRRASRRDASAPAANADAKRFAHAVRFKRRLVVPTISFSVSALFTAYAESSLSK
jgi:hypothetical protein